MNNEQIPALREAVENMATMREAYNNLSQAAEAYNTGKVQLAANITAKGVQASASETLPELAEKVSAIAQESYTIDGGEMYAKQLFGSLTTPNYWNLYEVLTQLLSDGRLVSYGGILLAEYYKGYDSLALSGAGAGGAYVVSDKDANGQFIMYTNDTTHTWDTEDDGKGNRWVAYCFADAWHNFDITDTNTSPRSIFIGREVGTIKLLTNARTSEIVVPDGNILKDFDPNGFAANFGREVVLRNIESHTSSELIYPQNTEAIYIEGGEFSGNIFNNNALSSEYAKIISLIIKCNSLTSQSIFRVFYGKDAQLGYLCIDAEIINTTFINSYTPKLDHLKNIVFLNVEQMNFVLPHVLNYPGHETQGHVYIGYKTNDKTKSVALSWYNSNANGWVLVPDVELKDCWCKPLDVSACIALTEANMYAHILQRLKQDELDCGDGVTIVLGQTNIDKLTSNDNPNRVRDITLLNTLIGTYGYAFTGYTPITLE